MKLKKNKDKQHLQFYYDCMKTKKLPKITIKFDEDDTDYLAGLCECAENGYISKKLFYLITPDWYDEVELIKRRYNILYCGSGFERTLYYDRKQLIELKHSFTPLRQTIVLFMAALNDEF